MLFRHHLAERNPEEDAWLEVTAPARVAEPGPNPGLPILKFIVSPLQQKGLLTPPMTFQRDLFGYDLRLGNMTYDLGVDGTNSDARSILSLSLPPFQHILHSMCRALDPEVQESLEGKTHASVTVSEPRTSIHTMHGAPGQWLC